MAESRPPNKRKSNKGIIVLLVGGVVILATALVIYYVRSKPEPEPEPKEPKVEETVDVPAPLVMAQKQAPIEAEDDAGPEVPTADTEPEQDEPKPKGGSGAGSEKMGKIDGKAVNRYINTRFGQVRTCYERRLKINPLLAGKVDLNIGINTKGKASAISVTKDTVRDPQMISCIKGVIRSWDFPKPEGGKVVIAKQFTFKKKI
jgi:hypothetical protein